jgi:cytochrome c-type biogenesis protein CcmH
MMLPFLLAGLTFFVLAVILGPLLRGESSDKDAAAADRAVYRDQLREIDRDIERGLLNPIEGESIRVEVQRRLLAVPPTSSPPRPEKARLVAVATGLITATGAVGLYLILGLPSIPPPSGPEAAAINRLAEQVRANPADTEAWTEYARVASRLDRWDDAETAWRRVISLGHASPEAVAALGEITVLRQSGTVGPEARGMFEMALKGDPQNNLARYYLALASAQAGDARDALAKWQDLLDEMPPASPGRQDVLRRMAETAQASGLPMPAAADRNSQIEAMVTRLADRLAHQPDDEAGWERLGRSYAVLGRADAAADAYEKAAALKPSDPQLKLSAAEALLANLRPEDAMPPRALTLLHQLETTLPDEPAVLWYLGLEAARGHDLPKARDYWTRLTQRLPPDGEDAKMVHAALDALSRQN